MRVLVTGGNGFVGSRVVRALAAAGHAPHLLLRSSRSNTDRIKGVDYTFSQGDIMQPETVQAAAAGCDACIHLACVSSWADLASPLVTDVAETGTENTIKACAAAGVKSFIYISSLAACACHTCPTVCDECTAFNVSDETLRYSVSKNKAEQIVLRTGQALGMRTIVACLGEVYGPLDFAQITSSNIVSMLDFPIGVVVSGGVCVVHVEDAARGIVSALERGQAGRRYIFGGEPCSLEEIFDICANQVGKLNRRALILPGGLTRAAVRALAAMHLPTPIEPVTLDYGVFWWWASSARSMSELGWSYRSAEATFRDTMAWMLTETDFISPKLAKKLRANMGISNKKPVQEPSTEPEAASEAEAAASSTIVTATDVAQAVA